MHFVVELFMLLFLITLIQDLLSLAQHTKKYKCHTTNACKIFGSLCENSATCVNNHTSCGFSCDCAPGFMGLRCQQTFVLETATTSASRATTRSVLRPATSDSRFPGGEQELIGPSKPDVEWSKIKGLKGATTSDTGKAWIPASEDGTPGNRDQKGCLRCSDISGIRPIQPPSKHQTTTTSQVVTTTSTSKSSVPSTKTTDGFPTEPIPGEWCNSEELLTCSTTTNEEPEAICQEITNTSFQCFRRCEDDGCFIQRCVVISSAQLFEPPRCFCSNGKPTHAVNGCLQIQAFPSDMKGDNQMVEMKRDSENLTYIIIGVAVGVLFVAMASLSACFFILWRRRVLWVQRLIYTFLPYEDDESRPYDAFVSFRSSGPGEEFAVRRLLPRLEEEWGYRLLIHTRDFVPGYTIADNILEALEASRRVILLLTMDFMDSEWCRMEYMEAQQRMLQLKTRIVPILLEDINQSLEVDANLRYLLQSVTYIEVPENSGSSADANLFWGRLRYALPKKRPKLKKQLSVDENSDVLPSSVNKEKDTLHNRLVSRTSLTST